tara:strand:- start:6656 stop:7147 length:492 start_codon:yes stop_codon:yes gene_type:complete
MYKQRTAFLLLTAISSVNIAVAQQSNPFDFAEPPKQETEAPPAVIVPQNPDLSDRQLEQVGEMISKAMEEASNSIIRTDKNTVKIDNASFLLLRTEDQYIGITSGMHVIYASDQKDYFYFDSQVYKKVLTEKDFNAMKSDMAKNVASVIGQLIDESGLNNNSK